MLAATLGKVDERLARDTIRLIDFLRLVALWPIIAVIMLA